MLKFSNMYFFKYLRIKGLVFIPNKGNFSWSKVAAFYEFLVDILQTWKFLQNDHTGDDTIKVVEYGDFVKHTLKKL